MSENNAKIEYVEVSLDEVMRFFAQNFKPHVPSKMECIDTFVDAGKNKVIFKMLTTPIEIGIDKKEQE